MRAVQCAYHGSLQHFAVLIDGDDRAVATDEKAGRDLLDAVGRGEIACPLAAQHVDPADPVFDEKTADLLQGRIRLLDVFVHRVDIDTQDTNPRS